MMATSALALDRNVEIGVVGAGSMGAEIALVAALGGHVVHLYDANSQAPHAALERLAIVLKRRVDRGQLDGDRARETINRIRPAGHLSDIANAGLVVEAIVENPEIKAGLFANLEALLDPQAIIATNTSSLSIAALAARLSRPQRFVGMHFFNPASVMRLVEVVSGAETDPDVTDCIEATARTWGKDPVRCTSSPGFIVNRVARPFYAEALRVATERAATPATLDAIMRDCGGFPMGPFELMDLIGHDVNFAVTTSVYEAFFQDPRYRPSLLQKQLIEAGRLGRKSGAGFYVYGVHVPRPDPDYAPEGPRPDAVVITGDLGPANALVALFDSAGIAVTREAGPGAIHIGDVAAVLTDGRTAVEHSARSGRPTATFDLALDFALAPRLALAPSANMASADVAVLCGAFQAIGKTVSLVADVPGLLVARTVAMLANEAADGLGQGLASAADIDRAMMKGANYPVGPLAWADQVGSAWIAKIMAALNTASPDGRYRAAPLIRRHAVTGETFFPV